MEVDPNNLHHAYLILGPKSEGESLVASVCGSLGLNEEGNPDFHAYRVDSFDIESAREVRERAREKSFGSKKIFLISAERFTHQAQNALLKTLEEPSPNVHFFILLDAPDLLLPTLLSRMQVVRSSSENSVRTNSDFNKVLGSLRSTRLSKSQDSSSPEAFLKLSLKDRLNFAKDFADKEKSLPTFLDSLMSHLRKNDSDTETLEKIFIVRRFVDDPSKSSRLILEHLALVLN
jgi:hypothetical protein